MNFNHLLLRLYPREWRDRYGDEFLAVLEARPLRLMDALDVALNALDAHINPNLAFADASLNERVRYLMQKLRSAEIMIFSAWIAFVVAGLHFYGLLDDSPYFAQRGVTISGGILGLHLTNPLIFSYLALEAGAAIALLAVLVGGLPLAYAAWRRSPQVRRFFVVPVIAFVTVMIPQGTLVALHLFGVLHGRTTVPLWGELAFTGWLIIAAAASTWAVTHAISRADIDARLMRFAYLPGIVATLAMALMLGATIAWGVAAHIQMPHYFDSLNYGIGYPTAISWGVIVLTMTVATIIAVVGCMRGMGARGDNSAGQEVVAA